ncbi:hypothetical protein PROFUN_02714 [Planoprotostelium fungivorum]|uniref:Uncharacterized protein n=1 Tax=Planoprotostelium fungivorum TaxID=1890364 RepID=A0A2P6NVH8_9EUKA|nr:hypothetical protein PROFUN_02714 [Planoprotostelium fungivorum]
MTRTRTFVVGCGLTKFERAGSSRDWHELTEEALQTCMKDANVDFMQHVDAAVVGYCYGEPTCGQRAIYSLGHKGIPVFNTNNNCSTGSSAIFLARTLIEAGSHQCVIALGFEKMQRHLSSVYTDRGWSSPLQKHYDHLYDQTTIAREPIAKGMNDWTSNVVKMFGEAALEHQKKYGTSDRHFAMISHKNHRHSVNNPYSKNRKEYTLEEIQGTGKLWGPLTSAQAAPTGDGAAAVLIVSQDFLEEMMTDTATSFDREKRSMISMCGTDMTREAAKKLYKASGLRPRDVDVLEVHDCFSSNELMVMEALGLCEEGRGGDLVEKGRWITNAGGGNHFLVGDRWVVNPSGGLESKGHPISATGVAQCIELCWQLRGEAGKRQVGGARVALQHNLGLGSAVVITAYKRYETKAKL